MSTVTLDGNDEDRFHVQGLCPTDPAIFQPVKSAASGLSPASSIGRVKGEAHTHHHRPQLDPPKHYMLDLLDLHREVEGTVTKELIVFKAQSKVDLAEIERLEKEKEAEFRKNAEDAASRNNWSVLGNVAQYLTAGASIAVGLSLGPTSWGSLLVASGVVGLGNRLIRDTVGWQSMAAWLTKSVENQKRLVQRIEMGFLAVELGTGLTGGLGSALTGSFSALVSASRLDNARKMVTTIQMTSSVMTSTSKLGKTFVEKRISDLEARMRQIDAHAERIRMEINQQVTGARDMIDMAQAIGQEMHKAIAASEIQDL